MERFIDIYLGSRVFTPLTSFMHLLLITYEQYGFICVNMEEIYTLLTSFVDLKKENIIRFLLIIGY